MGEAFLCIFSAVVSVVIAVSDTTGRALIAGPV